MAINYANFKIRDENKYLLLLSQRFFFCIAFNSLTEKKTTYYSHTHTKSIKADWAPNMEFCQPTLRRRGGEAQTSGKDRRCQNQSHCWRRRTAPALENLQGQPPLRHGTSAACSPHTSEDCFQLAPTGQLRARSCSLPATCGLVPHYWEVWTFQFFPFKLLILHCKQQFSSAVF